MNWFKQIIEWFQLQLLDKKKPIVHVIGDSHASFCFTNFLPVKKKKERSLFFDKKRRCEIHWLGPLTMFRVGRDGLKGINLREKKIRDNSIAVFVFGEIDVRCHIEKQSIVQNLSIDVIIEELVKKYIHTILENKQQYQNLKCILCTIVPPTDRSFNVKYPFFGTLESRISITQQVNQKLKAYCEENGLEVLDLYEDYVSQKGDLRLEYSDGGVHISHLHNRPFKEKLSRLINN